MQPRHVSPSGEWLSTGDAAKVLGVPVDTVRRWADEGLLPVRQPGRGRHRRFRRADLDEFNKSVEQITQ